MKTAGTIFVVLIVAWLVVSPVMWIYWHVKRGNDHESSPYVLPVVIGTFLAFMAVISEGMNAVLVFIPDSWGSKDEAGEFVTTRRSIGMIVGFIGSIAVMQMMEKTKESRGKS